MVSQADLIYKIENSENFDDLIDLDQYTKDDFLEAMKLKPNNIMGRYESILENKVLKGTKLSITNLKILTILMFLGPSTQTKILKYMHTTAANLSQRTRWLEKNDYVKVKKASKTGDRRKKIIEVKKPALKEIKHSLKLVAEFKKKLSKHFTKKELMMVMKYFSKLSWVLDQYEKKDKI